MDASFFWVSYVLIWIAVVSLVALNVSLFRQLGQAYLRSADGANATGLSLGADLTGLQRELANESGHGEPLERLAAARGPLTLVFVSQDCSACRHLLVDLERAMAAGRRPSATPVLLLVRNGSDTANMVSAAGRLGWEAIEVGPEVFSRFQVQVTPFAMMFGENQVLIRKGVASRADEFLAVRHLDGGPGFGSPDAYRVASKP